MAETVALAKRHGRAQAQPNPEELFAVTIGAAHEGERRVQRRARVLVALSGASIGDTGQEQPRSIRGGGGGRVCQFSGSVIGRGAEDLQLVACALDGPAGVAQPLLRGEREDRGRGVDAGGADRW